MQIHNDVAHSSSNLFSLGLEWPMLNPFQPSNTMHLSLDSDDGILNETVLIADRITNSLQLPAVNGINMDSILLGEDFIDRIGLINDANQEPITIDPELLTLKPKIMN